MNTPPTVNRFSPDQNLVFLSYGAESEFRRAIFSILSFYAWSAASDIHRTRILVYTDQPHFFQAHLDQPEIEYVVMTPQVMEEMLGGTLFYHRRKIASIDMTFKKYPQDSLIFIDSDTFFTGDATALFNGITKQDAFMHQREYTFEQGLGIFKSFNEGEFPQAFIDYITDRDLMIGGKPEKFTRHDYGWNSGVLGLHSTFAEYMPDVFRLNDEFYKNSCWFISEQIAFSLILQRRKTLHEADEFVLHYWGKRQKVMLDKLLVDLLKRYKLAELKDKTLIKRITTRWKFKVEVDKVQEQAAIALSLGSWLYGLKKSAQVLLKDPLNVRLYQELINAACSKRK
ncbi:hypothetical protein [Pedobacter cryoconitis]|uniref:Glycosyl transferase family 8 n=1 Tax=Pedobacter cryoconitis TaxID=188932 RepID=A0A327S2C6_9SPHI|nr:hypothetical protein [Pedobacter cryoconitis]RAJ22855.1 hypothetical protein LY11_04657 [Pedobacter cryoconitis]